MPGPRQGVACLRIPVNPIQDRTGNPPPPGRGGQVTFGQVASRAVRLLRFPAGLSCSNVTFLCKIVNKGPEITNDSLRHYPLTATLSSSISNNCYT